MCSPFSERGACPLAGALGAGAAETSAEHRALCAWLTAQTPGGGQLGLTPGSAMLKTPHLQGLLQQLRISTPSLGAQVPFMLHSRLQGIHRHHMQPQPGVQLTRHSYHGVR